MASTADINAVRRAAARPTSDPIRAENRRRITVTCINSNQVLTGCKDLATLGETEHVVYESDLEDIRRNLEEPGLIEQAKAHYERSRAEHLAQKQGDRREPLTWADVALDYQGPITWPHAFAQLFHRQVRPLTKLVVHDEVIDPPLTEEERRFQITSASHADAIVKAVAAAMTEQRTGSPERRK